MAIIFSDNFNSGNFNAWTDAFVNNSLLSGTGCNGSLCLSCGSNLSRGIRNVFPTLQINNTFRFNFAYLAKGLTPTIAYLIRLSDDGGFGHMHSEIYVNPDGSVRIHSFPQIVDSAPRLIPTNGTWMAVQLTVHQYQNSAGSGRINNVADFQLIVNNVVKMTSIGHVISGFNYTSDPLPLGWQGIEIIAYREAHPLNYTLVAMDNFEIEDSVSVIPYLPCDGSVTLYEDMCGNPPVPKPTSGLYFINSAKTHDIYYNMEKKIPDPTIKTGGIGE